MPNCGREISGKIRRSFNLFVLNYRSGMCLAMVVSVKNSDYPATWEMLKCVTGHLRTVFKNLPIEETTAVGDCLDISFVATRSVLYELVLQLQIIQNVSSQG